MASCRLCNKLYSPARKRLGFDTCMQCGQLAAKEIKHTVAPLNKSNYMLLSAEELKQLNPKRTT
jgi:hypothetical protein